MDSTQLDSRPFHRGAEADLYLTTIGPWKAVVKRRVRKKYRVPQLDERIRRERTIRESHAISDVKRAGIRAPSVIEIDLKDFAISMSYVEGTVARAALDSTSKRESSKILCEVGEQLGLLHGFGMVHGDMTTSNIIISTEGHPFLVDFGMSSHSTEAEDRGTDLHLLQRSIATSHLINLKHGEKPIQEGYRKALGTDAKSSFRKQKEIARRGRYFAIR